MNEILPNVHLDFISQAQHLLSFDVELMGLINVKKCQLLTNMMATFSFGIAI